MLNDIVHAIQISAGPEVVYPLVSTATGFGRWWAEDVWETDGAVELGFFARQTVYRISVQSGSRPLGIEWLCQTAGEWQDTRLVFRMESSGDGTLLHFVHAGWRAETDYFVVCNTTWGELMYRLRSAAQGTPRGPLFLRNGMAT